MTKWIYIMADRPRGTLYIGVTADLLQTVFEHRDGQSDQYGLGMLVFFEEHTIPAHLAWRERELKSMRHRDKIDFVEGVNPDWDDLWGEITQMNLAS